MQVQVGLHVGRTFAAQMYEQEPTNAFALTRLWSGLCLCSDSQQLGRASELLRGAVRCVHCAEIPNTEDCSAVARGRSRRCFERPVPGFGRRTAPRSRLGSAVRALEEAAEAHFEVGGKRALPQVAV